MNSSRRKLAALLEALGVPPSARRSAATPAAPACESLEGRQLLWDYAQYHAGRAVKSVALLQELGL